MSISCDGVAVYMATDGDDSTSTAPDGGVGAGTFDVDRLDGRQPLVSRVRASPQLATLLVGLAAVVALFVYDAHLASGPIYGEWEASRMDWLTMVAAVGAVAFVVVPAVRSPERVAAVWEEYPKTPVTVGSLVVVMVFLVTGAVAPALVAEPVVDLIGVQQPPAFMSVPTKFLFECVGEVSGGHCYGTMEYPLGTTEGGADVLDWTLYGARVAVQFALVTTAIMAPIAVVVGTTAGYFGGRVDDLLMGYVDVQAAVPAVVVYFILIIFTQPTLFALVVVFGLFSWEDLARSVRADVISEREEGYVLAARNAGAGPFTILRRHIVPNVSGTILTGITNVVPKLIMIEALFAFVGLAGAKSYSWGRLIYKALQSDNFGAGFGGGIPTGFGDPIMLESLYWMAVVPAVAIGVTVLSLAVVGDALQRAIDPTEESR